MKTTRRAACELTDREKTAFLAKWDELKEQIDRGEHDKAAIEEGPESCFDRAGWRVKAVVDKAMPVPPRDGKRRVANALHVCEPGSDTPIKSRHQLKAKLWPSSSPPPSESADARLAAEERPTARLDERSEPPFTTGVCLYNGRTPLPCMPSGPCAEQRAPEEKALADNADLSLWRRTVELGKAKRAHRNAQKRASRALAAETARADEAVALANDWADWAVTCANDAEAAAENREAALGNAEKRAAEAEACATEAAQRASEAEARAAEAEARATNAAAAFAPVARVLKRKVGEITQLLEGILSHSEVAEPPSQRPRVVPQMAKAAASPPRIDDNEPVYRSICAAEMEAA